MWSGPNFDANFGRLFWPRRTSFRDGLAAFRGRIDEGRFGRDEPAHAVDRRILVRGMRVGAMAYSGREPGQVQVLVERERGHRAPARRPDLGHLSVGLDGLDRGARDPRGRVGPRRSVRAMDVDPQIAEAAFREVSPEFPKGAPDRHVLHEPDVDLRIRLVRQDRLRPAMVHVPGVDAADVDGRLVQIPEEEGDLPQIVLELRDLPLPEPR